MKQGTGKFAHELEFELEAEVEVLRETTPNATMQVTLLQKAIGITGGGVVEVRRASAGSSTRRRPLA